MPDIVVITGAATGMGRLAARTLAHKGHVVYASMRGVAGKNRDKADEVKAFAAEHAVDLQPIELDVLSEESIATAIAAIVARRGRIDVLVHNAAHLYYGLTEAFPPEQVLAALDTNAVGALRVNRAVLPVMRAQRSGLLLWVGSGSTRVVPPFLGPYTAAKAALDAFAEVTAYEVARYGIETSILMPGIFVDGTAHFPNAERPRDTAVEEAYRPLYGDALDHNEQATRGMFPPGAKPDVQAVADEIARIVDLPRGRRPYRSTVDFSDVGNETVDAAAMLAREHFMKRMGLSDLLSATAP